MSHSCESCGMSIDTGRYCPYCVDSQGHLQDFDTRFERMVQFVTGMGNIRDVIPFPRFPKNAEF